MSCQMPIRAVYITTSICCSRNQLANGNVGFRIKAVLFFSLGRVAVIYRGRNAGRGLQPQAAYDGFSNIYLIHSLQVYNIWLMVLTFQRPR